MVRGVTLVTMISRDALRGAEALASLRVALSALIVAVAS